MTATHYRYLKTEFENVYRRVDDYGHVVYVTRMYYDRKNHVTAHRYLKDALKQREELRAKYRPNYEPQTDLYEKDLTGRIFGHLTVLRDTGKQDGHGHEMWLCQCDCGRQTKASDSNLLTGITTSCGHVKSQMAGARFKDYNKRQLEIVPGTRYAQLNDRKPRNNTSGEKYIHVVHNRNSIRYRVVMIYKGKQYSSTHGTMAEAIAAREALKDKLWPKPEEIQAKETYAMTDLDKARQLFKEFPKEYGPISRFSGMSGPTLHDYAKGRTDLAKAAWYRVFILARIYDHFHELATIRDNAADRKFWYAENGISAMTDLDKLKTLMTGHVLTNAEIARRSGVPVTTVNDYYRKPDLANTGWENIHKIAVLYDKIVAEQKEQAKDKS
ncbi:hypothetical protein FD12_GL001369 [Lentilactobacillus rapi DSM 19907 = JCM 15042]|uniref:Uncharacterized protein n=2 Tax=Lentilactobacillus rapi TaxID=481723 RepID=A0A512PLH4_9LACO|nr:MULTISPECIES: hypothetical protein [Lactobacillaceae]KRL17841.1 hypothetical protein FD12_GL001369 [Lentilactobacillus rapi DSM 19907 = JCM 15042]GEP72056.1 hypothetical protein LRA02_09240 [Lentilactobacillus rapi]